jgi:hypothetical protein
VPPAAPLRYERLRDHRQVERIKAICGRHGVPIEARRCISRSPVRIAAIIPGASRPERIAEDYAALSDHPDDFWHEMRAQRLVSPDARCQSTARNPPRRKQPRVPEINLIRYGN